MKDWIAFCNAGGRASISPSGLAAILGPGWFLPHGRRKPFFGGGSRFLAMHLKGQRAASLELGKGVPIRGGSLNGETTSKLVVDIKRQCCGQAWLENSPRPHITYQAYLNSYIYTVYEDQLMSSYVLLALASDFCSGYHQALLDSWRLAQNFLIWTNTWLRKDRTCRIIKGWRNLVLGHLLDFQCAKSLRCLMLHPPGLGTLDWCRCLCNLLIDINMAKGWARVSKEGYCCIARQPFVVKSSASGVFWARLIYSPEALDAAVCRRHGQYL